MVVSSRCNQKAITRGQEPMPCCTGVTYAADCGAYTGYTTVGLRICKHLALVPAMQVKETLFVAQMWVRKRHGVLIGYQQRDAGCNMWRCLHERIKNPTTKLVPMNAISSR